MKFRFALLTAIGLALLFRAKAGQTIRGTDQLTHYYSSSSGSPSYEGAVEIISGPHHMASLYAFNNSASTVYLKVQDSANSGSDSGPCVLVLPITAGNFVNVGGGAGWKDFSKGIYVAPFNDATCSSGAGSVMFYSVDYQ